MLEAGVMQRSFSPPPAQSWALPAVVAALLCAIALGGCGGAGRKRAREQIVQSGHAFTAAEFCKAAARGDQALVEAFIAAGMDRNERDESGGTALMAAAAAGRQDVAKSLLDENAKPDLQNKEGSTALILAATANRPDMVRLLVESNADVRIKDRKNWTALMKAVYEGYAAVVNVLLETSHDQLSRDGQLDRALSVAALLGNNEIVRMLLDRGVNVNAAIENHQTALMYAATGGKTETVSLLLDRGADPRMVNTESESASILALQRGHPDIAKLIDSHIPIPPPPPAVTIPGAPAPLTDAQTKAAAATAASTNNDRAWLAQHGMASAAATPKEPDDDGDGFSNEEELAAGTDPKDPKSHPPYAVKLHLKRIDGEKFPVIFDGADGKKVHLRVREKDSSLPDGDAERKEDVALGERVPGVPFVAAKVKRREISEKDTGHPLDVSELTLSNVQTGENVVLVKSMPANSPDATAILSFGEGSPEIAVKQGQKFTLPRDETTRYEVLDIRPTQVILKVVSTGQTITVGQ
jgi:ankyrin repeat protein